MRIKIEKPIKKDNHAFYMAGERQEDKKKKEEKMTVGEKLTTIRCHMPHHMKKDMMVHLIRQRKVRFGY